MHKNIFPVMLPSLKRQSSIGGCEARKFSTTNKMNLGKAAILIFLFTTALLVRATTDNNDAEDLLIIKQEDDDYEHGDLARVLAQARGDVLEVEDLPRRSLLQAAVLAAHLVDADGDGFLTATEMREWLLSAATRIRETDTAAIFKEMDVDQDNKVSWEELEQYQHDAADDGTDDDTDDDDDSNDVVVSARLLELKQRKLQEARELFDAADTDDDNFLNETEHQAFREPDRFDHTLEVLYRQTMERKDTDGDGSLNKQEFVANVDVDEDARPAEFEDEDDNDDGLMTKEELMAWLRHDYSTEVDATVAGLLAADSDGDQRLTLSELKSAPRTLRRHSLLLEGARLAKALDERRARDEL